MSQIEALARVIITDMLLEANPQLEKAGNAEDARKLKLRTRPLGQPDLDRAKAAIKPSTAADAIARYGEWTARYGMAT